MALCMRVSARAFLDSMTIFEPCNILEGKLYLPTSRGSEQGLLNVSCYPDYQILATQRGPVTG